MSDSKTRSPARSGKRKPAAKSPAVVTAANATAGGSVFVTGATGFIGRHLVSLLLARPGGRIFVLVRASSLGRLEARRPGLGLEGVYM